MGSLWASTHWIRWFVRKRRESIDFNADAALKNGNAVSCHRKFCCFTLWSPLSIENFREATQIQLTLLNTFKWTSVWKHRTLFLFIIRFSSMQAPKLMINLWSFVATKPVGYALKYLCNHYNPHDFRVEFLLDLAFLSLQLKQHQTASDCLKELRATDVTVRLTKRFFPYSRCCFCNSEVCCFPEGRSACNDGVCAVWAGAEQTQRGNGELLQIQRGGAASVIFIIHSHKTLVFYCCGLSFQALGTYWEIVVWTGY